VKITEIQTLVCNARMRNWIFVKVITDQPGLHGWGEATLEWHTRAVLGAIEDVKPLLIGQDPTRIEYLWQMMHRQHFWHSNGIVKATAVAGIDIALWDILGKVAGMPCYKLWGGPVRDHVRLYCHLGGGNMERFYETPVAEANRFADLAREAVAAGFSAFKCMAVPPTMPLEGLVPMRLAERCVQAMREAVGDSVDIMVDCHARPSPAMGLQFARALEPFGLYFLEEPCWPEMPEAMAAIASAVRTPIATGERLTSLDQYQRLLSLRACSVVQPDITHCGGLSAARRIASLVEATRTALAPHNPQGPVSTAASLQLGFAEPSYVICETVHLDVPWRNDVVREPFSIDATTRTVRPAESSGLGIELDEQEIAKHPFEQELPQRVFLQDGSVGDW
jgi:galactonate dehydratase